MTSFLVFMPALLLSGFMFPVSSMPELFQWLTVPTRSRCGTTSRSCAACS
jgi:CRISPR/Cas system CMR subunit Cmr4 (Cas7 group RAMP superfamily)